MNNKLHNLKQENESIIKDPYTIKFEKLKNDKLTYFKVNDNI